MFGYYYPHKICDPIHGFIRFDEIEKKIIDSKAFQRLRHIHQLGVAYLVYPGATHKRFEHSLGVMELVTQLYLSLTAPHRPQICRIPMNGDELYYWLRILRLAALCHDLGHLPFSHTAEKSLLTGGHEEMTKRIIQSDEYRLIWREIGDSAEQDIIQLALSFSSNSHLLSFSCILSQAITDDNFGADRIDYLLRDAQYTGVGYGHFDFRQLIDSVRILQDEDQREVIGISSSGMQAVESLWIARYLMYARVYHLDKVRIYSSHMKQFIIKYYQERGFPSDLNGFLEQTDYLLLSALQDAAKKGDCHARILMKQQECYKLVSLKNLSEAKIESCVEQVKAKYGDFIFFDESQLFNPIENKARSFKVLNEENQIIPAKRASTFLQNIPLECHSQILYVHPSKVNEVKLQISEFQEKSNC